MAGTRIEIRFGQAVRNRRMELKMSQEKLGERTGLHRTYVCDVERGKRNLSLENIEKIAAGLQISIGNLFAEFTNEPVMETPRNTDLDAAKSKPEAVCYPQGAPS